MSFIDDLNEKNKETFTKDELKYNLSFSLYRPFIDEYMKSFERSLKYFAEENYKSHKISKFLVLNVGQRCDERGSYHITTVSLKDKINPFVSESSEAVEFYSNRCRKPEIPNYRYNDKSLREGGYKPDMTGIYDLQTANELKRLTEKTLNKLGFSNIEVSIGTFPLKRVCKVKQVFFSNKYKIYYEPINQTGYTVHFNATW